MDMTTTAMSMTSSSTRIARVAIAQLRSTRNKHTNLINIAKTAGWAKREGATMLFLPECLGFIGDNAEHTLQNADPSMEVQMKKNSNCVLPMNSFREALADTINSCSQSGGDKQHDDDGNNDEYNCEGGPIESIIAELRFIAQQSNLWISGGGIHTATEDASSSPSESKIYNTHVIIDEKGKINSFYHKIHLFDVSIPGKLTLKESKTTTSGQKLVVCDSPVGKLALTICYDLRFPEMYVQLVRKGGAEVILIPSAFTVPTGHAHWHALLRARAIESQCYVIAAAQVGQHNEKRKSYGHSLAYDPWGELLVDAGGYDNDGKDSAGDDLSPVNTPSIVACDIDLDLVKSVRERMPIQQHRSSSNFTF
jgi:deaminated glutathione amidase